MGFFSSTHVAAIHRASTRLSLLYIEITGTKKNVSFFDMSSNPTESSDQHFSNCIFSTKYHLRIAFQRKLIAFIEPEIQITTVLVQLFCIAWELFHVSIQINILLSFKICAILVLSLFVFVACITHIFGGKIEMRMHEVYPWRHSSSNIFIIFQ